MSDGGDARGVDEKINVNVRHWTLITELEVQQRLCHFGSALQCSAKSFYRQIKGTCRGNGLNALTVSTRSERTEGAAGHLPLS